MSPIKPRGPAAPKAPQPRKTEDPDQTIAEPPRDFTDEIFRELTGGAPALPPVERDQGTLPMPQRPAAGNAPPAFAPPAFAPPAVALAAPPQIAVAPPSGPQSHVTVQEIADGPSRAPMSAARGEAQEVRVQTPLWALLYLALALLGIAFGLFVLFMQSRVAGHF